MMKRFFIEGRTRRMGTPAIALRHDGVLGASRGTRVQRDALLEQTDVECHAVTCRLRRGESR
jgi:hypothetical protein